MSLNSPIVTVFGATGFIGRAVIAQLARTAFDGPYGSVRPLIRAVTRSANRAEPLRMLGEVGQVTPVACNPADGYSVAAAVAGSTGVVNCIGLLTESRKVRFAAVQGELPGVIAQALLQTAPHARFVQLSAIGADANSPSAYARSKAAGEGLLRALYPAATILRPSVVFGPEDAFFNRFAKLAMLSPVLPLFGSAIARLQPVYVEDVAAAVVACLRHGETAGKVYELGGPAAYTFRDLMQLLLKTIRRDRHLLAVPHALAVPLARLLELAPGKPLTRDQLHLLARDNVVNAGLPGLPQLGIAPTALEAVLPAYLSRFRPQGQFNRGE